MSGNLPDFAIQAGKPDLQIKLLHFFKARFLPADFEFPLHLIKTERIKIATVFSNLPCYKQDKALLKKRYLTKVMI
jgi:hypothetical protein